MNGVWSEKWKKALIWFSAYASFVAFALTGGYVIVKNDDEELKKTTKTAFFVTLIFAAISAFLSIFYNFASMSDRFYNSGAYDFYSITTSLVAVAKIVVYTVFIVYDFLKKDDNQNAAKIETAESNENNENSEA